ncbi:MAG TPA: hypothetical protein VLW50_08825 [Streptosporangiaceae bacterium]|nr:hypothetical protein [Streptosporangiaceae bacterium]
MTAATVKPLGSVRRAIKSSHAVSEDDRGLVHRLRRSAVITFVGSLGAVLPPLNGFVRRFPG